MTSKLERAANKINETLNEKTNGLYLVSLSKDRPVLIWFKRYTAEYAFISRNKARWSLYNYGLNVDEMLAEQGLA